MLIIDKGVDGTVHCLVRAAFTSVSCLGLSFCNITSPFTEKVASLV